MDFIHLQMALSSDCPSILSAAFGTSAGSNIDISTGLYSNPHRFIFYQNGILDCNGNDLYELSQHAIDIINNYLQSNGLYIHVVNTNNDKTKGDNHMKNTYKDETDKLNKQLREDALKLAEDRVKRDAASGNSKKAKAYLKTLVKSMKIPAKPKRIDTQKIHKSNY